MNENTLERLFVDARLGELDADARELLDAYLATRPQEIGRLEALGSTLEKSRNALRSQVPSAVHLPPLRAAGASQVIPFSPTRWTLSRLAIAAALALSFFAGDRFGRISEPESVQPSLVAQRLTTGGSFWTVRSLTQPCGARQNAGTPIRWNSPLNLPTGEKS